MKSELPLVLGGHSYIRQLGNDPAAPAEEQARIVGQCLDRGIAWFDTTYQPERLALGRALRALGRRAEARIIAWNFFIDFDERGEVGGPDYYRPQHLQLMLDQLQTDYIDVLVVHAMGDAAENQRQDELARSWQAAGRVKQLGTWHPDLPTVEKHRKGSPYQFVVRPYNITTRPAAEFAAYKSVGWTTLACSPFVRGWELDKMVAKAKLGEPAADEAVLRQRLANHMLRFSLYQPNVDKLIVSIRRSEWVEKNAAAARQGPLSAEEASWLQQVASQG